MVAPRFSILLIGWLADTMWNLSVGSARLLEAFPRRIQAKTGGSSNCMETRPQLLKG